MASSSLEQLIWHDCHVTGRLLVKAPKLKKLEVRTGRLVLRSRSLERLCLRNRTRVDSAETMDSLKHLTLVRTDRAALIRVLTASPNLTSLDIETWHQKSYPSLQELSEMCPKVRCLRFDSVAWSLICEVDNGEIFQSGGSPCFQELQRLHVELDWRTCTEPEALSKLGMLVAACKSMQQMNITLWHKDERREDVLEVVKGLAQEYPSSWFVVEGCSVPPKRFLAVKSNRILGS